MIISLYGPDGVGKSTFVENLKNSLKDKSVKAFSFSGTHVHEWPELDWHNEFVTAGIDEGSVEEDSHFIEKIVRCHNMAARFSKDYDIVIIDSDPVYKTLTHDYMRAKKQGKDPVQAIEQRLTFFKELLAKESLTLPSKSVYMTLKADIDQHGPILMSRILQRGEPAHFDPKTEHEAQKVSEAANALNKLVASSDVEVTTVAADLPVNMDLVVATLCGD